MTELKSCRLPTDLESCRLNPDCVPIVCVGVGGPVNLHAYIAGFWKFQIPFATNMTNKKHF
jgi:hypothetical protein